MCNRYWRTLTGWCASCVFVNKYTKKGPTWQKIGGRRQQLKHWSEHYGGKPGALVAKQVDKLCEFKPGNYPFLETISSSSVQKKMFYRFRFNDWKRMCRRVDGHGRSIIRFEPHINMFSDGCSVTRRMAMLGVPQKSEWVAIAAATIEGRNRVIMAYASSIDAPKTM